MRAGLNNSIPEVDRAEKDEFNPFYAGYISLIPARKVVHFLMNQHEVLLSYLGTLDQEDLAFSYGEGKWTRGEVIGHIIDTERVMAYRALCISRGDQTPLPGFDQEEYMKYSNFNERSKASLVAEFEAVRTGNIEMICSFNAAQLAMIGNANGSKCSVKALISIIAGHCEHHMKILKERYI